jgi:Secretion system C-terminal sorting domain
MKCNLHHCFRSALVLVILSGFWGNSKACDLSNLTLLSITPSGPNVIVSAQLCLGYGRTGGVNGADGNTQDILFGFFDSNNPINVLSFGPTSTTSPAPRNCTMFGGDIGGPLGAPFDIANGVFYAFDQFSPGCSFGGALSVGYTCITSTASCGNALAQCQVFTFTLDALPDSMRVFGVEGAGNPTAGCYPNPDMAIYFTALPVAWGELSGASTLAGNQLKWSTLRESNNRQFEILRSADGVTFAKVGTTLSKGNTDAGHSYDFLDSHPIKGAAHYKLRQIDLDGNASESDVVTLSYTGSNSLQWLQVGPVPAKDHVRLNFLSDTDSDLVLTLVDLEGKSVQRRDVKALFGSNSVDLPLDGLAPGMYFLRLQGQDQRLDYKLMKL